MHPAPMEPVDAIVHQHLAFLTERGFAPDSEPPRKEVQRDGFRTIVYRGERWAVEVYLEYREGSYDVNLVPLEQGKAREAPFGYRTRWGLADYLSRILGIQDKDIDRLRAWYRADRSLAELVSIAFAEEVFTRHAALLARYLDVIVASPHPPVGRE